MSADEIIWQDPPESALTDARRRTRYTEFAQALRDNPGKWAVLPGEKNSAASAKNTASNLRGGKMGDFPKGEYQTAVDGTKIFVRYNPEGLPTAGGNGQNRRRSTNGASEIRQWAREHGMDVADRGALPEHVTVAYQRANNTAPAGMDDDDALVK